MTSCPALIFAISVSLNVPRYRSTSASFTSGLAVCVASFTRHGVGLDGSPSVVGAFGIAAMMYSVCCVRKASTVLIVFSSVIRSWGDVFAASVVLRSANAVSATPFAAASRSSSSKHAP